MKETPCGCCEGIEKLTPLATANRPGLGALRYRIGTHASFLETMLARLSNLCLGSEQECKEGKGRYPLRDLKTRERSDPAIALLNAWATVADVLTFYQERIANEGYLRTATERRSILELARLVGYKLRPGVASSVYLAYTLDENFKDEVVISTGARAQSVPGPGELPQTFETGEDLKARARWNNLRPRATRPQTEDSIRRGDGVNAQIYLKGISTNLKPNDPLLIDFGGNAPEFHRVKEVKPDAAADRTLVTLQLTAEDRSSMRQNKPTATQVGLITELTRRPSFQPANSLRQVQKIEEQFSLKAEAGYAAVSAFAPVLRETLATAAANAKVTLESAIKVYTLRVRASLFGHNAPKRTMIDPETGKVEIIGDWPIIEGESIIRVVSRQNFYKHEEEKAIYLDARYDEILSESWIVVKTPKTRLTDLKMLILRARNLDVSQTRAEYGLTGATTRIELDKKWIKLSGKAPSEPTDDDFQAIRNTGVYAQSEELELAEEPIKDAVCGGTDADDALELDGFYEGLEPGRWVIVSGEREIEGTSGVRFSELAMLAAVRQDAKNELPGDKTHTFIKLAEKLQYCFKRDTVTIYGNVVKATHGETRKEVLGGGDGSKSFQAFTLKQPPLTFVASPTPAGAESTLKVYVNDVEWHETDALAGLSPTDRRFITKTDDESKTTIISGNGREGARLPTGIENIKAEYRNGIGKSGNVKAGQITLLQTRPLGVKEVINPLRASGGADREGRDQARKNAPLTVTALDRLVSVQDYADFARTFAGIGKAYAVELSDGRRKFVHLTVAGADDIPIDETSDLFRNLRQALHDFGDPVQPFQLAIRELMLLVISARVRILPDYQWESVEPKVRAALLDAFSFERRELGQDALLSEVISVIQGVHGVAYVDVDLFRGIPEKVPDEEHTGQRRLLTPDEITKTVREPLKDEKGNTLKEPLSRITISLADLDAGTIQPTQLAFLTPDVPATLSLIP